MSLMCRPRTLGCIALFIYRRGERSIASRSRHTHRKLIPSQFVLQIASTSRLNNNDRETSMRRCGTDGKPDCFLTKDLRGHSDVIHSHHQDPYELLNKTYKPSMRMKPIKGTSDPSSHASPDDSDGSRVNHALAQAPMHDLSRLLQISQNPSLGAPIVGERSERSEV
ncbi:hypothetical protein CC80DRAFT_87362 [Byssothecium circinans]|uniref:Uncharacterized protein n=1 Tax=Byssothecium circinans TaxID=147558 RepID=A0A6A5TTF6_9PLEO|nr:hypothetical protein CC80DRAFT_87362 [Byssothecium circinans]